MSSSSAVEILNISSLHLKHRQWVGDINCFLRWVSSSSKSAVVRMKGAVSEEVEVAAPVAAVWGVYGTLELAKVSLAELPHSVSEVEVLEGDGGEGTVLAVHLASGKGYYKEKYIRVDHENHVKEAMQIEGGFLAMGFNSYVIRFEILEKGNGGSNPNASSSIVRTTIEYDIPDECQIDGSIIPAAMAAMVEMAEAVGKHLAKCVQEA